ncbi:PTS sugar transporter subunit IIA [Gemmatimonadota bacterium]
MRLSTYLREDLVIHGMDASTQQGALEAFGAHLEMGGFLPSGGEAVEALKTREAAHTTVLGEGVAVPHATVGALPQMLLLVATTPEPIPFGPPEADLVDLFFVLLSPTGREGEHIKLLARICRLIRHPGVLDEIRGASGGEDLLDTILRVDSQHV